MRFLCVFPPCVLPTAVLHDSIIILCLSFLIFIADLFIRRVRKIAKSDYQLRHVCLSAWPSPWNNPSPTGRICMKFGIWVFFEISVEEVKGSLKSDRKTGTLREVACTFMISRSFLLRIRNVSDTSFRDYQNTHFMSNSPPPPTPQQKIVAFVR